MASKGKITAVWMKARWVPGKSPYSYRKDAYGNTIRRGSYGTNGKFAWEIDHKRPKSKGGSDHLRNLQPLHRDENRAKGAKLRHKGR